MVKPLDTGFFREIQVQIPKIFYKKDFKRKTILQNRSIIQNKSIEENTLNLSKTHFLSYKKKENPDNVESFSIENLTFHKDNEKLHD